MSRPLRPGEISRFEPGIHRGIVGTALRMLARWTVSGNGAAGQVEWFAERYEMLARNVETFIRGKPEVVRAALVCLFAEGHLLIEDVPGVGKTSLAKAVASSLGATMRRIQFTPDLLPTDVTGVQIYDDRSRQFEFRPGPVFANVVLADEINRASPKTQSALLEVMEERQVTMDGTTYPVAHPFIVMATPEPVEHEGVYRLPEAQLDRFLMRVEVGYPAAAEREIVENRIPGPAPEQLQAVLTIDDLRRMMSIAHQVYLAPGCRSTSWPWCRPPRRPELRLGVSPRGSVGVAVAAQSLAAAGGRPFVTAQDVKTVAPNVLAHRMILRPEAQLQGHIPEALLDSILSAVPVPQDRSRVSTGGTTGGGLTGSAGRRPSPARCCWRPGRSPTGRSCWPSASAACWPWWRRCGGWCAGPRWWPAGRSPRPVSGRASGPWPSSPSPTWAPTARRPCWPPRRWADAGWACGSRACPRAAPPRSPTTCPPIAAACTRWAR